MKRLLILCLALLLLSSCGDDEPNRPELPPHPLQATSPEEVSDLLEVALEARSIERYDSLLTRDYRFIFNPVDTPDDTLDIPPWWGLEDEIQAVRNLFSSEQVEDIMPDWTPQTPTATDSIGADSLVIIQPVFIEVVYRLPNGEPLFLQAQGDFWLHVRRVPWTTDEGDPVWKVVIWEDKTQLLLSSRVEKTTWGQIKAMFR